MKKNELEKKKKKKIRKNTTACKQSKTKLCKHEQKQTNRYLVPGLPLFHETRHVYVHTTNATRFLYDTATAGAAVWCRVVSCRVSASAGRKGPSGAADVSAEMFLGHLCPIDEYRVYGYMTSTRLKLLAVLEDVNDIREPELKRVSEACDGRGYRG